MGVDAKTEVKEEWTPEFEPISPTLTMGKIREAIPARLFKRYTLVSMSYLARDVAIGLAAWQLAMRIAPAAAYLNQTYPGNELAVQGFKIASWLAYYWVQSLCFTGLFVQGHECGHGGFSSSRLVCDIVGFATQAFLLVPYISWKTVHHRHHANHQNINKDEHYLPKSRSYYGVPAAEQALVDWDKYFEDTPIWALGKLIFRQTIAFPAWMLFNISGQPRYKGWTSFYNPGADWFSPKQYYPVLLSDVGILGMGYLLKKFADNYGYLGLLNYYVIPWMIYNHWIAMITYLHHSDPTIPYYTAENWTFQRGAVATVDRDFLGWQGRFFLHDISHYHVVHHFFPSIPHYHCKEATEYLKGVIGEHYHRSSVSVFVSLWETFNECQFVDYKPNSILWYRDKKGDYAIRKRLAQSSKKAA